MTVNKFLNKWYNKEFEDWGGETSSEYNNFQTNYKSVIKEICNDIGMNLHSFNKNHYEFSAIVKSNTTNQFYYISISDVRYWKNEWANNILFRTMENDKDWTGGRNCYSKLQDLSENLMNLDLQIKNKIENKDIRQNTYPVGIENDKADDLDLNYV